jgi:hypothetical protein
MLQLGASIARLQPDASTQGFAKTGFEYQALATRNAGQTGPRSRCIPQVNCKGHRLEHE